jgi:peptidyl-prolyl cis-trans isomerase D
VRAADAHESALARLEAGESVADIADSYGLQWERQELIQRNSTQVPREILQAAFALRRPEEGGKTVGQAPLEGGGQAVITVTRVQDGNFEALSEIEVDGIQRFLADRSARVDFEGFYQSVEEGASIARPE